jgi:hypothetical protein
MTPSNKAVELTSEPEIIDSSETQESTNSEPPQPTTTEKAAKKEEDAGSLSNSEVISQEQERPIRVSGVFRNRRNYSPSPPPRRLVSRDYDTPSLINTAALNDLIINESDICADTANNNMIYITNTPFHAADLDKMSWILKIGIQDTWVQKPVAHLSSNGYQFDLPNGNSRRRGPCYDDGYYDDGFDGPMNRRSTPIARFGNALRVFKTDEEKYGTKKVKFVIAVQGKNNAGWLKLVVSHSRQAAAVDIFHEILNNHSILFVGAVLQDVVIPVEAPNRLPGVKFQRVGTLKEAEEVGKDVIGVIC